MYVCMKRYVVDVMSLEVQPRRRDFALVAMEKVVRHPAAIPPSTTPAVPVLPGAHARAAFPPRAAAAR